ncbi:MAG: DedA family protein [Spirochaetes bacterium]|nr:DedA family protein [Spirochaetota bacterium]MBU1079672.1 DedA family protein [Spirochaetota bacterium]
MVLPQFFQAILLEHALPAFFLFLLFYSFSLPICEEVALVIVGMIAQGIDQPLWLVMLVAYPGIFGSDVGYYWLARRFGGGLLRSRLVGKLVNRRKVMASELYFKNRGPRIAFFCRFLVGIRAPAMIAAGILRMPFRLFALYDGLAAVVSTCVWLSLGYFWGDVLGSDVSALGTAFAVVAPIALVVAMTLAYRKVRKTYSRMCEAETEAGAYAEPESLSLPQRDREAM